MEPLDPGFRLELKKSHPGLSDETIDRYEELLARRFQMDPEEQPKEVARLDREREELLLREMPRYREVSRQYHAVREPRK